MDRRLAAIMFTDIVGYTRMAQARESLALELLEEHRKVVRPLISSHDGTEVKTIGDAFLIEFKSALEAVLCAVDIQNRMTERNSGVPTERRVQVRVGVHLGDVVHEGGDVYGDAVNVASRIEPLALPGGICISQQVFDNIRNKTDLGIEKMGAVELKNVELPVAVYRVNLEGLKGPADGAAAPKERLAVLPFVNISPDPNDEYFADGLTEELISKLSEVKGLKVIARTSVMNYKGKEKSVMQIGRELGAGSIIEGSVRKAGKKIRVTVQLIDSRTEEHLWASNYDKELDDIFAIQSDVAAKVAGSVSDGLLPTKMRKETMDVEAYSLYIRGLQRLHESESKGIRDAVALFQSATARDPSFAKAYAGLALAWLRMGVSGYIDYGVTQQRAEEAAQNALRLDPDCAEAHAAMASVANMMDRSEQVVAESEAAIRANPNLAEAHLALGIQRAVVGDFNEGLASMEKAYELDPLSVYTVELLARTCWVSGRVDRGLEVLNKLNEFSPMNPLIINALAECYMAKGDLRRAQELITSVEYTSDEEPLLVLNQGLLHVLNGRKEEALESLKKMESFKTEAVRLYGRLFINAGLGNLDEAFRALERMKETHSWPFLIATLPIFADLRKDPRYVSFADMFGLPIKPPSVE
jgi:adenylate cyclase